METITSSSLGMSIPRGYLWNCPQEIQDMIFELAFQRPHNLKLIFKRGWGFHEEEKSKADFANYVPRAFPRRKVHDWMVSKRFFGLAARAWFYAGEWRSDGGIMNHQQDRNLEGLLHSQNGLFVQFTK
jgi:hypothetical protein